MSLSQSESSMRLSVTFDEEVGAKTLKTVRKLFHLEARTFGWALS